MDSLSLPAPPVFLSVTGLYDVEYRIVVACRTGQLCVLKRGWAAARVLTSLDSQPVGRYLSIFEIYGHLSTFNPLTFMLLIY